MLPSDELRFRRVIRDNGLNPDDFAFFAKSEYGAKWPGDETLYFENHDFWTERVIFKDREFFFELKYEIKEKLPKRPGYAQYMGPVLRSVPQLPKLGPAYWPEEGEELIELFDKWLKTLKPFLRKPRSTAQLSLELATTPVQNDERADEPFTNDEKLVLKQGLDELKEMVSSLLPAGGQQIQLEGHFALLIASLEKQTRRQWFQTAVGVLAGLAISAALEPDKALQLFLKFRDILEGVVTLAPKFLA
jgi:hypothetical protein